jgi:hypothetical protein
VAKSRRVDLSSQLVTLLRNQVGYQVRLWLNLCRKVPLPKPNFAGCRQPIVQLKPLDALARERTLALTFLTSHYFLQVFCRLSNEFHLWIWVFSREQIAEKRRIAPGFERSFSSAFQTQLASMESIYDFKIGSAYRSSAMRSFDSTALCEQRRIRRHGLPRTGTPGATQA